MPRVNEPNAFAYRVDFAAAVISRGGNTTRTFDSCFENDDGSAVAVALYRRSRRNPKLRANLWKYIRRDITVRDSFAQRRRPTSTLAAWAAELRAEGKRWLAQIKAGRATA